MTFFHAALLSLFPALVIIAGLTDVTSFTIPNRVSLLLVAGYALAAPALGRPLPEIGVDIAVGLGALIVAIGLFSMGWIGGGDAKLFAAASLWLGWSGLPLFLMATALAGGALALVLLQVRAAWLRPYLSGGPAWLARLAAPESAVPYGVAIAVGALVAFPHCSITNSAHGVF
jgi:prepilin peptidase CpaA